jgi:uncharacterized Ntn-hydrolase superfamily protein
VLRGTYSIVARDPETGSLGVAVQSHWFSVGSIVPWALPGVGAVATQSIAEPAYGPRALKLLREGSSPGDALDRLLRMDGLAGVRQVAVLSASGEVAVHTGGGCVEYAGHETGEGFSCQANMMAHSTVPTAMAEGFERAHGSLAERLLAALDAAEAEGGDMRGSQSAAMLVVAAEEPDTWRREVDLRVEDHHEPLRELRRLLPLQEAYTLADRGDTLLGEKRFAEASAYYERASALAPANAELQFWSGLGMAQAGDVTGGAERVRRAIGSSPGLAELLNRLPPELAPGAVPVRAALRGEAG